MNLWGMFLSLSKKGGQGELYIFLYKFSFSYISMEVSYYQKYNDA